MGHARWDSGGDQNAMTAALMLSSERARRAASHSSAAASPMCYVGKGHGKARPVRPASQNTQLPIDRG
eukprot:scaffold130865_cov69-Phaeocystis_antarctica.AAC.5